MFPGSSVARQYEIRVGALLVRTVAQIAEESTGPETPAEGKKGRAKNGVRSCTSMVPLVAQLALGQDCNNRLPSFINVPPKNKVRKGHP